MSVPGVRVRAGSIATVLLAVACTLAAGSGAVRTQEAPGDDEAQVRALVQAYFRAYAGEDVEVVRSLWSQGVPGLERILTAFALTLAGKDVSFADIVISRLELKTPIASARVTLGATIVDLAAKTSRAEAWARNIMCVKDPEGWRVWRDGAAVDDVAVEIRSAGSAARAAAIVEREPDLPAGEISQALFGLGNRLRMSGMPEDAQQVYSLSAGVAARSGDPLVMGQSLTNSGVNAQLAGDYDRALESFERALSFFELSGDRARIAGAHANIGSTLYLTRHHPGAIRRFQQALEFYEVSGDRAAMASTLHSIGNAQYLMEDLGAALDSYEKSLALRGSVSGDILGEANTLQAIGLVQKERGDYDAALEAHAASLARHEQYGNKAGMGLVLASEGDVHRLMGEFAPALDCYFRALPLLSETGDQETLASTYADIANVFAGERRYPLALDYYARSLPVFEKTGNTSEIARVLAGAGAVHFAQGKYGFAMEEYRRSLQLFEQIGSKPGIAWTLAHMGLVHQAVSQFAEAQGVFERGLAIVEELNDRPAIAITLALLARARVLLDRPHEGRALAERAAAMATEIGGLDTLARAKLVTAQISRELAETAPAERAFRDAVVALERLQAEGAAAERSRFFGDTLAPYLGLVALSVDAERPEEALTWLERGKAYLLRNSLGGTGALVTKGMTEDERARERVLARRLVSLSTQLGRETGRATPDEARLARLQSELDETRTARVASARTLYEAHPDLEVLRAQGSTVVFDGRATLPLPASAAVVEFAVGEAKTYVFVVRPATRLSPPVGRGFSPAVAGRGFSPAPTDITPKGATVTAGVIDIKAVDLAARIAQFRGYVAGRDAGVARAARELYELLLKPVEAELAGATRLVIVPDAVLWALPLQALQPRDGRFLLEDRAVSYAPSLGAFVEMVRRGERRVPAGARVPTMTAFGVASPGAAAQERLSRVRPDVRTEAGPEAPREAAAVVSAYGPARGRAYAGETATWSRLRSDGPQRSLLHLAVPIVLNDSSPMSSQIVFAPARGDAADIGLVETWQLMSLDLNADVAVLSRGQGEPGQSRAGDGAGALAWALLAAGTPTTVLSSWVVDAPSTTSLLVRFHGRLAAAGAQGFSAGLAADALRRATLALLADPMLRHPYYWAGFSVFGK